MALFSIKPHEVKSSDTNANNEMKPYALLHALEDAAYTNAESLGWGYSKTKGSRHTPPYQLLPE